MHQSFPPAQAPVPLHRFSFRNTSGPAMSGHAAPHGIRPHGIRRAPPATLPPSSPTFTIRCREAGCTLPALHEGPHEYVPSTESPRASPELPIIEVEQRKDKGTQSNASSARSDDPSCLFNAAPPCAVPLPPSGRVIAVDVDWSQRQNPSSTPPPATPNSVASSQQFSLPGEAVVTGESESMLR